MNTIIIASLLLLVALFFIFSIIKQQKLQRNALSDEERFFPLTESNKSKKYPLKSHHYKNSFVNVFGDQERAWWYALGNIDQLQLALMLAQKGLIVWEQYAGLNEISYINSPSAQSSKIDNELLQKTISEITLQTQMLLPSYDNKNIKHCYNHFVGPIIALQDGNWVPPYPVKKIFLSVYHILKSIIEQTNPASLESGLAISINQSLDCIDISKIYTQKEILAFLKVYKNKL